MNELPTTSNILNEIIDNANNPEPEQDIDIIDQITEQEIKNDFTENKKNVNEEIKYEEETFEDWFLVKNLKSEETYENYSCEDNVGRGIRFEICGIYLLRIILKILFIFAGKYIVS